MNIGEKINSLDDLRTWILNHLRLHVSDDGGNLDDLTQVIITDYWKFNEKQSAENRFDSDYMSKKSRALAYKILQRRVADYYRETVSRSSILLSDSKKYEEYGESDYHYKTELNKSILFEIIAQMTKMSEDDRKLLLRDIRPEKEMVSRNIPLSQSERKKISRLRKSLAENIERKYGEKLGKLLK